MATWAHIATHIKIWLEVPGQPKQRKGDMVLLLEKKKCTSSSGKQMYFSCINFTRNSCWWGLIWGTLRDEFYRQGCHTESPLKIEGTALKHKLI